MEGLNTFFLGIIALCMIIITAGMVGIFFVLFGIFKTLKELLLELKLDYKVISPKVHQIVENLENTTSIFSIFSIFKRNKKK
ncbi:MAG TPA: hypothetical protein EYH43_05995 [Persephonella sp.]|nr:hypothetical protein [Hydrogenothermaceae bacterium]HIQ25515.1 hypothetical protein [Persephonella sp.]